MAQVRHRTTTAPGLIYTACPKGSPWCLIRPLPTEDNPAATDTRYSALLSFPTHTHTQLQATPAAPDKIRLT